MIFLHFNLQNPPAKSIAMRDSARAPELVSNRKLKKPQKIAKKSLNPVLEDMRISKESADFSLITEFIDENSDEFCDSSFSNPELSPSPEASIRSYSAQSSVVTAENSELSNISMSCNGLDVLEGLRTGSVKLDIAVNFLKETRSQVLNSVSVNHLSKKIVDILIKTAVDDLLADHKERGQFAEFVPAKIAVVLLFLFFWILILAIYFRNLGVTGSFKGPLPT